MGTVFKLCRSTFVAVVAALPVNMAEAQTDLASLFVAILPGANAEEGISVASETKAASDTKEGSVVTHDVGDVINSQQGGRMVLTAQDVPIAMDACAEADAIVGRRSRRANRISSTLKQAAETAYKRANSMFWGTRVTGLGPEFSEQQRAQHHRTSGASLKRMQGGTSRTKTHHTPQPAPTTAAFHMQPRDYRNPRRGPVEGLRRAIQREERRRGRNLTPEEWQSVRDWCIQRNSLKQMGLDYCFINER